LESLFRSVHLRADFYSSADELLQTLQPAHRGCLLIDSTESGSTGLEIVSRVTNRNIRLPTLLMLSRIEVKAAVEAFKRGAVDCLENPFNGQALLDAVQSAMARDQRDEERKAEKDAYLSRFKTLTSRETGVLHKLLRGSSNRSIADQLGLSEKTVEAYRARIMRKTCSRNTAEHIRFAIRADLLSQSCGQSGG